MIYNDYISFGMRNLDYYTPHISNLRLYFVCLILPAYVYWVLLGLDSNSLLFYLNSIGSYFGFVYNFNDLFIAKIYHKYAYPPNPNHLLINEYFINSDPSS